MLLTKIHIPSPAKNLVHRSKLFEKLNEGLNRKLILISAPAGFGKTTLISDWINQKQVPAAWNSLNNGDNDPAEFLSYIISGIQTINPQFGASILKLLQSTTNPNPESVAGLLINDSIGINQDFLLVLDDFHVINSSAILSLVDYFLEHLPENIHIVISTRSDPLLPLARLRSQHQLLELRSADLSFSANDISTLFNKKLKLGLSDKEINAIATKTEGWIAGLQLAALSIKGYDDASDFIADFTGNNRYIMDYLIEEVLKIQSEDVKEFLLKTSILQQISAPLCDAILGKNNSQAIIEELEKNNIFLFPLDEIRHWYRYHHLFADLLKQKLLSTYPSIVKEIHEKACDWFEQNNMFDFAINHALEINSFQKCIDILNEIVEGMWETGRHSAILKYGDLIPDEIIYNHPKFCLYYSWILITAGDINEAEPFLAAAENKIAKRIADKNSSEKSIQSNKKLLGKISVAFAYLNSHLEHSDQIFDYCKTAMENLSEDNPFWYSWTWFSFGIAHFSNGELQESKKAFNKAFQYAKKSGNIYLISTVVIRLAENEQQLGQYKSAYKISSDLLSLIKNKGYSQLTKSEWTYAPLYLIVGQTQLGWLELDKAHENLKTAYDLSKKGGDNFLKIMVSIVYSAILITLGDSESEKIFIELDELMKNNMVPPFLNSYYIAWKIYLLMDQNQVDQANDLIYENGMDLNNEKDNANELAYSAYARLLINQNKLDEAESLLAELYSFASSYDGIDRMIDLKICYSQLYKQKGENENAVKCLIEAMEMAVPEDQLFDFVFWSDRISDELNEVLKIQSTTKTKIPQDFIDKIQQAIKNIEKRRKAHSESELSKREIETLKLIAKDISNAEIANQLFISLNTVKTHVRHILTKLGVEKRTHAVTKAKELGII